MAQVTVEGMATTTMRLDSKLRGELAAIAKDDFGGVPLAEAVQRLITEHNQHKLDLEERERQRLDMDRRAQQDLARWDEIRNDPEEWAKYPGDAREEYPEYNR